MFIATQNGLVPEEEIKVISERVREYQYHESELLNVLLDSVLPELSNSLSAEAKAKVDAVISKRQSIKQRYPKPI
ncbi:hypothetical protein PCIT_a3028 [Pseudoalteromonas citrea]|uniref:Uncharacterized protein n=2 Tax=Pseudoalteromonas citrea TaxID=43655 RepID=A0AAD4AIA1_9GAMM|nr:hypothetical protein [Pseudoalteromonas citrea]KAF7770075.1 hypothetical protein PCIT_a3028 [Pseudoalteromonas citrea]